MKNITISLPFFWMVVGIFLLSLTHNKKTLSAGNFLEYLKSLTLYLTVFKQIHIQNVKI